MELLKLVLVVTAVAISTFPRFSHSMTLFYLANSSDSTASTSMGLGLYKDGQYGIVCEAFDAALKLLCKNLDSFGNESVVDVSQLNASFINYNCRSGLSSCGDDAMIVPDCSTYSGPVMLNCPECYNREIELTNRVKISTDSGVAFVGYPRMCGNDGNFAPICNGTELGAIGLKVICAYQPTLASSGLVGNPYNVSVNPLANTSQTVTSYDCFSDLYGSYCAASNVGMTCTDDYALVTCEEGGIANGTGCDSSSYANGSILFNNHTTISADGSIVTSGIYQSCFGGSYIRYCLNSDQQFYPGFINMINGFCQLLGFSSGELGTFEGSFGDAPPGILSYDINCFLNDGSECVLSLCSNTDRQLVIRCTKSPDPNVTTTTVVMDATSSLIESFSSSPTSSSTPTSDSASIVISTSSSPTSSSTPTSDSGANVGAIVGGSVVGVIVVIVIVTVTIVVAIAVTMYVKKHKSPVVPISEKSEKTYPV